MNDLSYDVRMWAQVSFFLSSFCHNPRVWQTDSQTDGRTDGHRGHRNTLRTALHYKSPLPTCVTVYVGVSLAVMFSYSSKELCTLAAYDRRSSPTVPNTLFTLCLWRPAHRRSQLGITVPDRTLVAAACDVDFPRYDQLIAVRRCRSDSWTYSRCVRRRLIVINAAITERSLDVLALAETWHTASDDTCLPRPRRKHATVDVAHTSRRRGGVTVVFRQSWKGTRRLLWCYQSKTHMRLSIND